MMEIEVITEDNTAAVVQAADKAAFQNLRHAGLSIGRLAKDSIVQSIRPSAPGKPPATRGRGRKSLKSAIFATSDGDSAIIGPRFSYVGDSGAAHEFGQPRGATQFDERSFMGPALAASLPRFASDWQGSIGE